MSIQNGSLLLFLQKNKLSLGVCLQNSPKQLRVLTDNNRELPLKPDKALYVFKTALSASASRTDRLQAMKDWNQRLQQHGLDVDLGTLWEVVRDEGMALDIQTLAEMLFAEAGDLETAVLLNLLLEDRLYFERKGDEGFWARSAEKVQQIRDQQAREEARLRSRHDTLSWIHQCLVQKQPQPPGPQLATHLQQLQDVAIRQQKSGHYETVNQLLQDAGVKGKPEEKALQLMIESGVWDEDVNLHLLEYDVPRHFSQEVLELSAQLQLDTSLALSERQDLRGLETITIDDEETTDIDDAISWQALDNGHTRIWVHIADPACLIAPDSALDQEALKRFTSIYLCEGKIEMLPARLAQELCSLVQDQDRLALSVGVEISPQGELHNTQLCESVVRVDRRLSYDQVDSLLPDDPELQQLLAIAQLLKQKRLERGAVDISKPEMRIKVTPDKQIVLKRIERNSASQQLVSEMMILANGLVAQTLGEAGIPLIYKVQAAPTETHEDGRPLLKRAEMSTSMGLHYGLGLDAYTQFTSPIRRYQDLVLHRQIKHWLKSGEALYSRERLQEIIAMSDQALFSANYIQRENFRYWMLKYLSQQPSPCLQQARINYIGDEKAWLHLEDLCFDVQIASSELAGYQEGDNLKVALDQIQPRKGRVVVRRVAQEASPADSEAADPVSANAEATT